MEYLLFPTIVIFVNTNETKVIAFSCMKLELVLKSANENRIRTEKNALELNKN